MSEEEQSWEEVDRIEVGFQQRFYVKSVTKINQTPLLWFYLLDISLHRSVDDSQRASGLWIQILR